MNKTIEEIIENNVIGDICPCGGGGLEDGETCRVCDGTGIHNWDFSTAIEELETYCKEREKKAVRGFVEENRGFSYWENLKLAEKRYLSQTKGGTE